MLVAAVYYNFIAFVMSLYNLIKHLIWKRKYITVNAKIIEVIKKEDLGEKIKHTYKIMPMGESKDFLLNEYIAKTKSSPYSIGDTIKIYYNSNITEVHDYKKIRNELLIWPLQYGITLIFLIIGGLIATVLFS